MADELAGSVVQALSQYLIRKSEVGSAAYDAQLENLHGLLAVKLSGPFHGELLARFADAPGSIAEREALRVHLAQEIHADPEFGRQLRSALASQLERGAKLPSKRRKTLVLGIVGAAVLVTGTFFIARSTAEVAVAPASTPVTVTSVMQAPPPPSPTATVPSQPPSSAVPTLPSGSAVAPENPGDGSSLAKGTPVFVKDLPKPGDRWHFQYGDHDVRLTQYQNSLWNPLSTCNDDRYKGEQQFNLKRFSRLEAQAVGLDQTSDSTLTVKFEVFVNNDKVKPAVSVVIGPGESKPLAVDLPPDTFAVTLQSSLVSIDKSKCRSANAVWGTPFVTAAGR